MFNFYKCSLCVLPVINVSQKTVPLTGLLVFETIKYVRIVTYILELNSQKNALHYAITKKTRTSYYIIIKIF